MLPLDSNLDYDTVSEIEFQGQLEFAEHQNYLHVYPNPRFIKLIPGFTRIPVFDKNRSNVVAVLNVKQLTLLDASDNIPIRTVVEYYQNSLFYVFENTRLDYMFRAFREGGVCDHSSTHLLPAVIWFLLSLGNRGHMAFVQRVNDDGPGDPFYETIGVVTMEDVLEELLQADILDETDGNFAFLRRIEYSCFNLLRFSWKVQGSHGK